MTAYFGASSRLGGAWYVRALWVLALAAAGTIFGAAIGTAWDWVLGQPIQTDWDQGYWCACALWAFEGKWWPHV